MASLQKYFDYAFGTKCGIPGVEMTGSEEDWIRLAEKTKKLETLLMPIMGEIGLGNWFAGTHRTLAKLLDTYRSFINNKYRVIFLTGPPQFQYQKGNCQSQLLLPREALIGCLAIFFLVLKLGRAS